MSSFRSGEKEIISFFFLSAVDSTAVFLNLNGLLLTRESDPLYLYFFFEPMKGGGTPI
jgi:hypothetical protein